MSPKEKSPKRRSIPWYRKLGFGLAATFLGLVFLEGLFGLMWLVIGYGTFVSDERITQRKADDLQLDQNMEAYNSEYDEEIGWVHIPGRRIEDFYGPDLHMTINSEGFRGKVDYFDRKPEDKFRVVCLGDSMTMGYGVDDDQTYPAYLERIHPLLQTVNMGMGDYSTSQSGIWYRRVHEKLEADLLLFTIITTCVARNAMPEHPRPGVIGGHVEVINQPVPRRFDGNDVVVDQTRRFSEFLVNHSSIARAIGSITGTAETEAVDYEDPLALAVAMIDELAGLTWESKQDFAVVLLPHATEVPNHYSFNIARQRPFWMVANAVEQAAKNHGVPFLNLAPVFASRSEEEIGSFFLREIYAHYSPEGNEFVARELDNWLAGQFEDYPRSSDEK